MAYSIVTYVGDGSTKIFTVPFPYLLREHVLLLVGGVSTAFTWLSDTSIQVATAPANGASIVLYRDTPKAERMVDFQDASVLTEAALDLSANQTMYIVQEAYDRANETAEAAAYAEAQAANALASANIAVAAADEAEISAAQAAVSASGALTSASSASASAASASNSASSATTSASNAASAATIASTSASNAATSETNAAASASTASTAATTATTKAGEASTSATNAAASASAAATSASNAATSETNAAASAAEAAASAATVTPVETQIVAAASKATPADTDIVGYVQASDSTLKKATWTNLKAFLKTYFDTLYATVAHTHSTYALLAANTFTGDQTLGNNNLKTIKTATFNSQVALTTTTGAVTVNWSNAQNYKQNEPTGAITYTFTAPPGPCHLQLLIDSDGTSSAYTHVWPASVIWMGATWAQVANKKAIINFWYDGTNYYAMGVNQV